MTPISQGLPPLPNCANSPKQRMVSFVDCKAYGDARAAHARRVALEEAAALFPQPHIDYCGAEIQDAIKELI